ncbi:hypothetical protein KAFR_0L00970 [Kazachstania africana CBS 2517]|uniref:RRM domain-containing protein n=1 Tax=Kazachstania africana (strain ATCC 22294 / BCRC 22015 / CBS 2517 / CECT 1963 / NBRC 1671 / NRRL Y-8276) TaxID=1071382 RepID=H2B255_KAZAF|nr:hypothetical protein KAFR_0L00970 [Kazachstania africana CBS 2517]CCF60705.1 hypothetical protein KAFR_0L00970 [Kazachstania africana CBS 2517]
MSYNISKFPSDVTRLFKPNPPLPYKRPSDYPEEQRRTNPNITPVSNYLAQLTDYINEYSDGTPNKHLEAYEEIRTSQLQNLEYLHNELQKWDPMNDVNSQNTDPYKTIFIGRLPYNVTEIELQKIFIKFGEIEKIRIVKDIKTDKPKGYGFILFNEANAAKMAVREIGTHRGIEINGRSCIVDIERGRSVKYFKPRRLGGGLGGRGSSERRTNRFKEPGRNTKMDHYNRPPRSHHGISTAVPLSTPSRYQQPITYHDQPPVTSYRSRTARTTKSSTDHRSEVPDY